MARHFPEVLVLVGAVSMGCDPEPAVSSSSSPGGAAGSGQSSSGRGGAAVTSASGGSLATGQGGLAVSGGVSSGGAAASSSSSSGGAAGNATGGITGGSSNHGGAETGGKADANGGTDAIGGFASGGIAESGGVAGAAGKAVTFANAGVAGKSVTFANAGAAGKAVTFANAGTAGNADRDCIDQATSTATMSAQYARAYITASNNPNKSYVALANWWGKFADQTVAIDGIGFSVTTSATSDNNNPLGFPSLFIGTYQSNASSGSNLPKQLSTIESVSTVFDTNATSLDTSNFNAVYDIWLTDTGAPLSSDEYSPGAGGAYVMVWLYKPSNRQPRGSIRASEQTVGMVGNTWDVWVDNATPPAISYVAKTPTTSLSFDMKDFLTDSTKYGVKTSMYLSVIFAGFEIWSGGNGAKVNRFCADVR